MNSFFWENNLIYKVIAGSPAYGLDTLRSDPDMRGVCIPPRQFLPGQNDCEQYNWQDDRSDALVYALDQFVGLALTCDPSIIELLYADPHHVVFVNEYGQRLLDCRDSFLSQRTRHAFGGYAIDQMRRIEQHRHWLVDPPDHEPTPEEFDGQQIGDCLRFPDQGTQKAYQAALDHWAQYQAWRRGRDPTRAGLEQKHGYDTVCAMHLIRRLAMGAEIMETGRVHVYRHDREWLRSVRDGALSYAELIELVAACEARLDRLCGLSPLPDDPDTEAAEALVVELQERFLWAGRK